MVNGYDSSKLANVYLREEIPDSNICSKYFCISENRVIKSIFNRKIKTGKVVIPKFLEEDTATDDYIAHKNRYDKMKRKRRYSMLLIRELLWKFGKWKTRELNDFIDEFKPDIILHSMDGYIHMNRIVKYAIKRSGAKAIGYVWDDNFSYKQSKKIGHNIYRFFQRISLKKLSSRTDGFFEITPKTKMEVDAFFGVDSVVLTKPLNSIPNLHNYSNVEYPLNMVYTGNLLIGRDKALIQISKAIASLNQTEKWLTLDVYTQTSISQEDKAVIENGYCKVHSAITQAEAIEVQKTADVLLFLESMDKSNNLARLSFSTKITDYFSAGKCIFAVGHNDLAPIQYLKDNDTALVVNAEEELLEQLSKLKDKSILSRYSENAVLCGTKNHNENKIKNDFIEMIEKVLKDKNDEGVTNKRNVRNR
ncbi:MAG: hypothetical protein J6V66_07365 [Clostridia bacterium]|nr:hypothetical protein [Clostridia bacterium]